MISLEDTIKTLGIGQIIRLERGRTTYTWLGGKSRKQKQC